MLRKALFTKIGLALKLNYEALKEAERKQLKRRGIEIPKGRSGGFTEVIGILIALVIIAIIVGTVFYFYKNNIQPSNIANTMASELQAIQQGLSAYYSGYNHYPGGEGWGWNTNNAYIPQKILNEGWNYQCQGNKIVIITPPINNPKVLEKVRAKFTSNCDQVDANQNQVACILLDRPCWEEGQNQ